MISEKIIKLCEALELNTAFCPNSADIYHPELRISCEQNFCGAYGKNHTCPPLIGTAEECMKRALYYPNMLVFQKVYPLEDSYDFYGMMEAKESFGSAHQKLAHLAKSELEDCLVLGAGGCTICEKCAAADSLPCRYPDEAISSLEAHCIQVSELAKLAGMKYINGSDTVTYFGAVLYK